jgi:hypothetical protein
MLSHITGTLPDLLRFIRQNTYILGALVLLAVLVVPRARATVPGHVGQPS